ncbi:hypothetical protein E4U60_007932 [Claviceps pazoutovae]|uniref:Uncharacterized protein n=1 Tax=Claviceps pazoutovae TaxID=1649127 RepID=A0A9P7SBG3_9HYPO|nr:hypothetical protein E4U60_007932 [Claviceps pazoutovae]
MMWQTGSAQGVQDLTSMPDIVDREEIEPLQCLLSEHFCKLGRKSAVFAAPLNDILNIRPYKFQH